MFVRVAFIVHRAFKKIILNLIIVEKYQSCNELIEEITVFTQLPFCFRDDIRKIGEDIGSETR